MLKRLPLLIAVIALAVWVGDFIVKNFLAASLIAYGEDGASRDRAVAYAPSNPLVVAARGKYLLYRAEPPREEEAIAELQRATLLAPRDYRFWLELGRAYENTGKTDLAEKALRRSVELAPRYFETRWAFANFLLRAGKTDVALDELRVAVELSGGIAPFPNHAATMNALNTVAGVLGNDFDALRGIVPADSVSQIYLAEFLANHDALDQALEIWRRSSADEHGHYRRLLFQLLPVTQSKGRFAEMREIWQSLMALEGGDLDDSAGNLMINSGFELPPLSDKYPTLASPPTGFDWTVRHHPEVAARRDRLERHAGSYSLRLSFNSAMSSEFENVSQLILVEPAQTYRLSYFVKSKQIPSQEPPYVEIADAMDPASFNLRSPAPSGTTEWVEQSLVFSAPENTRAVRLTIRSPRLGVVDRLRIGEVWFDDFKLTPESQWFPARRAADEKLQY
jgi:tetratricopeptide (TPR) repeat protein